MTVSTRAKIPKHLNKYIVDQNYSRYTSEDQAVWRYILRQLTNFLTAHAHTSYLEGFRKAGLEVECIPRIEAIDEHLERFGWGAVAVSGFIPPAAFMEFQSIGVLPVASDMRSQDHLLYTPAPDIVHEAAGHAPLLVNPGFAEYVRQYGTVARHSILSKEDLLQYEAIRILSDIKEHPGSTAAEIVAAEEALTKANRALRHVSEAALLSRMNWWTAEYGLIGDLEDPKIFGAGLLSSVGESRACLRPEIRKIPLSVDCVQYSYDITEPQPQLFVAEDFSHLGQVLEDLAARMSYRRGGIFGLKKAIEAETVNTVELNSGVQISGKLKQFLTVIAVGFGPDVPIYLQFSGPSQIAFNGVELSGQGMSRHSHGFSCGLGLIKNRGQCLSLSTPSDLSRMGILLGAKTRLEFESGVVVVGELKDRIFKNEKLILLTFKDCRVTGPGGELLFDPAWGEYDMAVGSSVTSVFGGPADRSRYSDTEDFTVKTVPDRQPSANVLARHRFFQELRELRQLCAGPQSEIARASDKYRVLLSQYLAGPQYNWLQGVELLELDSTLASPSVSRQQLLKLLQSDQFSAANVRECVKDGIALASG